jgi:hypothetical protein
MELLIPGLLFVALMVYVSTRIKRSAAGAYEEEKIETDDFSVTKPAGFIIIEDGDPNVIFAAYSKDYGADDSDSVRQVTARLTVHRGESVERVSVPIKETAERVIDERHLAGPSIVLEVEELESGVPVETEYHLMQKGNDTFEFSVAALTETKQANQKEITTLLSSFELK